MSYLLHLVALYCLYASLAVSLNLVAGYGGMITLAHAAYFGLGAYTYAVAVVAGDLHFTVSLVLSIVVGALFSLLVSIPSLKLRGDFFVLMTLAVQILLNSLFSNWSRSGAALGSASNMTNGTFGITDIPRPELLGIAFSSPIAEAVLAAVFASVAIVIVWQLVNSPWGRLLCCVRDDEVAARSLGKHVDRVRAQAIAIACGIAAGAGGIYAGLVGFIDPSVASLDQSISILAMVVIGGLGRFGGPLLGAGFILTIPEVLRLLNVSTLGSANIQLMLYGFLLIVVMQRKHRLPLGSRLRLRRQ